MEVLPEEPEDMLSLALPDQIAQVNEKHCLKAFEFIHIMYECCIHF